jgi:hypothetical protein
VKKTLRFGRLVVQLDRGQVFPDDPGQGTPAIVRAFGHSATYWAAQGEGVLYDKYWAETELSEAEMNWLGEIDGEVTSFLYDNQEKPA